MRSTATNSWQPASPVSKFERFDCWPELTAGIVLSLLAYMVEGACVLVGLGGLAIIGLFFARHFVTGRLNFFGARTMAVLGYGVWMFFGLLRYAFGTDRATLSVDPQMAARSARYIALGFVALLLGLQLRRSGKVPQFLVSQKTLSSSVLHQLAVVFLLASGPRAVLHNNFYGYETQYPFYIELYEHLYVVGFFLLAYVVASDRPYLDRHRLSVGVPLVLDVILILIHVSRRPLVVLALGVAFIVSYFRKRQRRAKSPTQYAAVVLSGLLLAGVLYALGNAIRAVSFSKERTMEEVGTEFRTISSEGGSIQPFYIFEFVMERYPNDYPYLHGSSLVSFLLTFVPRVVWPGKPIGLAKELALRLAHVPTSAGYSREIDKRIGYQSYSATLLGEGYANFGWFGGLLFLFIFARLCCFIQNYLDQNRTNQFVIFQYACWLGAIAIEHRGDLVCANFFSVFTSGMLWLIFMLAGKKGVGQASP